MDESLVRRFQALFTGYNAAYGEFAITGQSASGKKEGRARTILGPPTFDLFRQHLEGSGPGIGIIPLTAENQMLFGALDIDVKGIDLARLEQSSSNLPTVVCRSKSGGAHLYLFLQSPATSKTTIATLTRWADDLGHRGCEIFPKQTMRASPRDVGNWINLPYYDAANTERYAVLNGQPLTLEQFLDLAESRRVPPGPDLDELIANANHRDSLFYDGPPCLQALQALGGLPDGTRNEGMYNVAIYVRKRWGEDWQSNLFHYNDEMCHPPLPSGEVMNIGRSISSKTYTYKCKNDPIRNYCDRKLCVKRRWGVGTTPDGENEGQVEISSITKYFGTPTYWVVDLGGARVEVQTETLYNQGLFAKLCMEQVNRCPPLYSPTRWHKYLDNLIADCVSVPAPEDASLTGQFSLIIHKFCTGRIQARTADEITTNKPFREDGMVLFRSVALFDFLRASKFNYPNEHWVWNRLRDSGAETRKLFVNGEHITVWAIKDLWVNDRAVIDEVPF